MIAAGVVFAFIEVLASAVVLAVFVIERFM
jgi:hypothetical protein